MTSFFKNQNCISFIFSAKLPSQEENRQQHMNFSLNFQLNSSITEEAKKALQSVLSSPLPFMDVFSHAFLHDCKTVYEESFKEFDHLLVLGVGGSALGTQSVLQALKKEKTVTVIDTVDPDEIEKIIDSTDWTNTAINAISKSGGTLETMIQLSVFEAELKSHCPSDFQNRIICTTEDNSKLYNYAQENNYKILPVPNNIGGRFSVLTPVGLFPFLFARVEVEELLQGAIEVVENPNKFSLEELITTQYQSYREGKNISILMSYQKRLMGLLDWYRQLLAESIGKNNEVGITPALAVGSTDQHSQIQLYVDGPKDKLVYFLNTNPTNTSQKYSPLCLDASITLTQAQSAFLEGTKKSLTSSGVSFIELFSEKFTEKQIGQFFMMNMIAIVALAKFFDINPIDQPGVEEGKIQAKNILENL